MTTPVEIAVGTQTIPTTEILIASLTVWHPFIDVYVDGTNDPRAVGSLWRVYGIIDGVATRLAEGAFNTNAPLLGQRVLNAVQGSDGGTFELRALRPSGPSLGPITGAIVGWDPMAQTANAVDTAFSTASIPSGGETSFANVPWHPQFTGSVNAPLTTELSLTSWKVYATIPTFTNEIVVAQGNYPAGQTGAQQVVAGGGGSAGWRLRGAGPGGAAPNVTGAIVGFSPEGSAPVGGVTAVTATPPVASSGGATPNIFLLVPVVSSVTATAPVASSGGATPNISITFPISDGIFSLAAAGDATKQFKYDLSGQLTGTLTTFFTNGQANRAFRTPNISGTALVAEDATGFVYIGGQTTQDHGSSARVQLTSAIANGAQFRSSQYGVNAGNPGMSGFKSRGPVGGPDVGILAGDVLFGITTTGVAPDGVSIPLAALFQFVVPGAFVPVAQNWAPSDCEIQLVALAGPINGRRRVFKITSEGVTQTLRGIRAGGPSTNPLTTETGTLWSSDVIATPEGAITGSPGDLFSSQIVGAGTLWVKVAGVGNVGWMALSTSPFPTPTNKFMVAAVTVADNDIATATAVAKANFKGGYVGVRVNGVSYHVGDGTKVGVDTYFSVDGGVTARAFSAIVAGDTCRWNGTVAGFQLAATDRLDFEYNTIVP